MDKIKIAEFVKEYDKTDKIKRSSLVDEIIVKHYAPLTMKAAVSQTIVNANYTKNGELHSNSVALYLSYIMGILELYTSLEVPKENAHEAYDLLQERGIVDLIISKIGSDVMEYETVFKMCRDDFETNNFKPHALCQRYFKWFISLIDGILEALTSDKTS